jgi:hypothetical protein
MDTSSSTGLLSSLEGMNDLSPLACVPVGGPHSGFKPDDPGTVLICRRTDLKDDLVEKCIQLAEDYRRLVANAEPFLNDESVPYFNRTFSRFVLKRRASP